MNATDGLAVEAKANREVPFGDQNSDSSDSEDLANVLTSKVNRRKTNLNLEEAIFRPPERWTHSRQDEDTRLASPFPDCPTGAAKEQWLLRRVRTRRQK